MTLLETTKKLAQEFLEELTHDPIHINHDKKTYWIEPGYHLAQIEATKLSLLDEYTEIQPPTEKYTRKQT